MATIPATETMAKKERFSVTLSFPIGTYDDQTLEEIVGKESSGSGAGFGERDMDWSFSTPRQALAAFRKLKKKTKLTSLVYQISWQD